jgi:thiol-disulfide isomerase/thioredoxin
MELNLISKNTIFFLILITLALLLFGCTQNPSQNGRGNSFKSIDNNICVQDGKPIIRFYSTSFCPHCQWVAPAYDEIAQKYIDSNQIIAYHWEWLYDSKGNLTGSLDKLHPLRGPVPAFEEGVFKQFNPQGSIPTFVFGCKYYRIGNQFEQQNDLDAEKNVFEETIQKLLIDFNAETNPAN